MRWVGTPTSPMLLRNGASLVEARELARHSNIRLTMRYTHIGLDDQAKAIAAIPAPRTSQPDAESWEHFGSKTCGKLCHFPSSAGNTVTMELATVNDENPCGAKGLDAACQPLAPDGTKGKKWRRRDTWQSLSRGFRIRTLHSRRTPRLVK